MPTARDPSIDDFRDVCFVIMPFGLKTVGTGESEHEVDFDAVYRTLFFPAIEAVALPESEGGGRLRAVRADQKFYTGIIGQEMFEYIEYSRFAIADITQINANVFYELGARHRAHDSGTAIFRQADAAIPFDINQVKAWPYAVDPVQKLEESKAFVTKTLTNSLRRNAWDSPIRLALRNQREAGADVNQVLRDAENALRAGNLEEEYRLRVRASELEPGNPLHEIRASAYAKSRGDWDTAIRHLHAALAKEAEIGPEAESTYSDAYRELGVAENKRDGKDFDRAGEASLRRAVKLAPDDFDAWASLGGILRRAGDLTGALEAYEKAVEVSDGHPYPLLMALKLRAKSSGEWSLDMATTVRVAKAQGFRQAQVDSDPPIDAPWCFFDLAEIDMYLGDGTRALEVARRGLELSTHSWQPGTFLSALEMLPEVDALPGLSELKSAARSREKELADA